MKSLRAVRVKDTFVVGWDENAGFQCQCSEGADVEGPVGAVIRGSPLDEHLEICSLLFRQNQ